MRLVPSFCKRYGRALLVSSLACGCSASGTAIAPGSGGSNTGIGGSPTGGKNGNGDVGGDSTMGAGGGGNPSGGAGPTTGGVPGTGGAPATGGAPCVKGTQVGATFSTNYFIMAFPQLSPFYVFNNGWSSSATSLTTAGALENVSTYETCTPGTISWGTTYNWSGANNTVKAYPAAILGWQKTKGFQVPSATTGLPKTISSLSTVKCSWAYDVSGGATQDIAFDLWVHSTSCSSSAIGSTTGPSDEIMIWLYANGGVNPIGGAGGQQVSLSGASWALSTGSASDQYGSWAVHSFVRQGNVTSVTDLDILAFLNNLNLGSKCLSSIEAGTEVFTGSGTLKTNSYTCTVQ